MQGGFKIQGDANKIPLVKYVKALEEGVHAKHPSYTTYLENAMNAFQTNLEKNGQKLTPENAREFVEQIMKEARETIMKNPSTKINAPIPSTNLMGGASEYNYSYDDLYRLTSATGSYKGANDDESYILAMSYNSVGGITQKTQSHLKKAQAQKKATYDLAYVYGSEQPHAPVHIGDNTYAYYANGNQTGWKDDKTGQRRQIMWDEENRMEIGLCKKVK